VKREIKVTVDALVFTERDGEDHLLLVRRKNEPFKGLWAFPGGFVEWDEDLEHAAARELKEETGIEVKNLVQVGAFGKPGRDPRGRTVTVAYRARIDFQWPHPDSDAEEARWHPLYKLPNLAFDHSEILERALKP